ncbi:MAG TPA: hypothetical protein VK007_08560 [Acidimicrobiales bacterium]|nr:hypothetical protein [Acidimicrobiales bacterium]
MSTAAPSPALATAHRVVMVLLPLLVLVQAAMAGQHLYGGQDIIEAHGYLGNATFALTVVNVPLALMVRKGDGLAFGLAVALVALTFAQVGLGYVGRETADAAAWHIPLGVTILGLASFQLSLLRAPR